MHFSLNFFMLWIFTAELIYPSLWENDLNEAWDLKMMYWSACLLFFRQLRMSLRSSPTTTRKEGWPKATWNPSNAPRCASSGTQKSTAGLATNTILFRLLSKSKSICLESLSQNPFVRKGTFLLCSLFQWLPKPLRAFLRGWVHYSKHYKTAFVTTPDLNKECLKTFARSAPSKKAKKSNTASKPRYNPIRAFNFCCDSPQKKRVFQHPKESEFQKFLSDENGQNDCTIIILIC